MKTINTAALALVLGVGIASSALAGIEIKNPQHLCLFARGVDYDDHAIYMSNLARDVNHAPYSVGMKVQICHSMRTDCIDCRGERDATWYQCTITHDGAKLKAKYKHCTHQFVIKGATCVKIKRDRI